MKTAILFQSFMTENQHTMLWAMLICKCWFSSFTRCGLWCEKLSWYWKMHTALS